MRQGPTSGANSTIICGVTVGSHAFVGTGTIVTKDVANYALVVGNPIRRIGWMSKAGAKLDFTGRKSSESRCSETIAVYQIIDDEKIQKITYKSK